MAIVYFEERQLQAIKGYKKLFEKLVISFAHSVPIMKYESVSINWLNVSMKVDYTVTFYTLHDSIYITSIISSNYEDSQE